MTQWWPTAFPSRPYDTWFYARVPRDYDYTEWPDGYYHFYKISAGGGHSEQLMFYSDTNRYYESGWAEYVGRPELVHKVEFKAGVRYIICYPGDSPNWNNARVVNVGAPCGNWNSSLYMVAEIIRSQTGGMQAAVSADRSKDVGLVAAVCRAGDADCELYAAIEGWVEVRCAQNAAVQGDATITAAMRASVQDEQSLSLGLVSAVGKDFDVSAELRAAIAYDWQRDLWIKAAIQGETGTTSALRAYVIKSRRDIIRLEFEPRLPQDFAQNSVPNWPSEPFDSRQQVVG